MENLELFEDAVTKSRNLPPQSNENLLKIYSLYKQATEGDIHIEKPGNPFDIPGHAKYRAWEALKGKTKEQAREEYIALITQLGS